MIIKVDEAGRKTIMSLCDVALKSNGIKDFNGVQFILRSLEDATEDKVDYKKDKKVNEPIVKKLK